MHEVRIKKRKIVIAFEGFLSWFIQWFPNNFRIVKETTAPVTGFSAIVNSVQIFEDEWWLHTGRNEWMNEWVKKKDKAKPEKRIEIEIKSKRVKQSEQNDTHASRSTDPHTQIYIKSTMSVISGRNRQHPVKNHSTSRRTDLTKNVSCICGTFLNMCVRLCVSMDMCVCFFSSSDRSSILMGVHVRFACGNMCLQMKWFQFNIIRH